MIKYTILFAFILAGCATTKAKNDVSLGGIILEKDTFDDVFSKFKKAEKVETGDASAYLAKSCFITGDNKKVTFGSTEMGGGKRIMFVEKEEAKQKTTKCEKIKSKPSLIIQSKELSLGLNKNQIQTLLGPNFKELSKGKFRRSKDLGGEFYENVTVYVNYNSKGLSNKIEVYKVTAN